MSTRWARFARGWAVALVATVIASCSHALAGGCSPNAISLTIAIAFSGVTCVALSGKTLSLTRLALSVAVSQFAFHTLFSTIGGAAGATAWATTGSHSYDLVLAAGTGTGTGTGTGGIAHDGGWMWLGHAVAALLTVVVLRHGERAFWGMGELAQLSIRTLFGQRITTPATIDAPRLPRTREDIVTPSIVERILGAQWHRGPPAAALA